MNMSYHRKISNILIQCCIQIHQCCRKNICNTEVNYSGNTVLASPCLVLLPMWQCLQKIEFFFLDSTSCEIFCNDKKNIHKFQIIVFYDEIRSYNTVLTYFSDVV